MRATSAQAALLVAILVLASGPVPAAADEAASARPVLHVEDPVYNWVKAYQGEQLQHTFTIENKGDADLIIDTIKSNCGCSVADENEYKKRLSPGETTRVTIRLDTANLTGEVKKDTDLITNATTGDAKLWMQGEVVELLKQDPPLPKVEVVRASLSPPEPTRISFTPNLGKTVKIRSVKASKGILSARLDEVKVGKQYTLTLLPTLDESGNTFQKESLEFRVEVDGRKLLLRREVSVVLKDRIEVNPSRSVYVHRKDTAGLREPEPRPVKKTLELASIGGPGHRFKIRNVTSAKQIFLTSVQALEEGRRYRLTVTLEKLPEGARRFVKDTIEVTTDDPEVPVIKIPAMAQF